MNREELEKSLKIAKTERKRNKKTVRAWDETIGSIKQQLKDLPCLEVGEWIEFECGGNYSVCIKELIYDENFKGSISVIGFGFKNSDWLDNINVQNTTKVKKAIPVTDKEVEKALIKEAKKRGFKKGVDIDGRSISDTWYNNEAVTNNTFSFCNIQGNRFCLMIGDKCIFKSGKWAEIIEQPKTVSLDGDYTSEQLKVYIKELEK